MTPASLDGLGLTFSLAVVVVAFALYGLHLYLANRRLVRAERARQAELNGPFDALAQEQRRKVERPQFRHAARHSRRLP